MSTFFQQTAQAETFAKKCVHKTIISYQRLLKNAFSRQ